MAKAYPQCILCPPPPPVTNKNSKKLKHANKNNCPKVLKHKQLIHIN